MRKGRRLFVAAVCAIALAGCSSSMTSGSGTTSTINSPPTSFHTFQSLVLWQSSGQGNENGRAFTIPNWASNWTETWTLRCPYSYGGSINLIFQGIPQDSQTSDFGADQVYNRPGSWHGVNYFYDHGTFQPQMTATCPWTERVVAHS